MDRVFTMDRFAPPEGKDAAVIALCGCGCGSQIVEGYFHIECDGEWYYDNECLMKKIGAKWRDAG